MTENNELFESLRNDNELQPFDAVPGLLHQYFIINNINVRPEFNMAKTLLPQASIVLRTSFAAALKYNSERNARSAMYNDMQLLVHSYQVAEDKLDEWRKLIERAPPVQPWKNPKDVTMAEIKRAQKAKIPPSLSPISATRSEHFVQHDSITEFLLIRQHRPLKSLQNVGSFTSLRYPWESIPTGPDMPILHEVVSCGSIHVTLDARSEDRYRFSISVDPQWASKVEVSYVLNGQEVSSTDYLQDPLAFVSAPILPQLFVIHALFNPILYNCDISLVDAWTQNGLSSGYEIRYQGGLDTLLPYLIEAVRVLGIKVCLYTDSAEWPTVYVANTVWRNMLPVLPYNTSPTPGSTIPSPPSSSAPPSPRSERAIVIHDDLCYNLLDPTQIPPFYFAPIFP